MMVEKNDKFNKRAFTIKEAAQYACVSEATVRNWIIKGLLPYVEMPGSGDGKYRFRRIRKNDLDDFLDRLYNGIDNDKNKKSDKELILLPRNS